MLNIARAFDRASLELFLVESLIHLEHFLFRNYAYISLKQRKYSYHRLSKKHEKMIIFSKSLKYYVKYSARIRPRAWKCFWSKAWLILNISCFESMPISLKTKKIFAIVDPPPRKPRKRGGSDTLKGVMFGNVFNRMAYLFRLWPSALHLKKKIWLCCFQKAFL